FTAREIAEVALSGPDLHAALRETVHLRDVRVGLHSRERYEVVAQMQAARGIQPAMAAGAGAGDGTEPPEPARRVSKGGRPGKAVAASAQKKGQEGSAGAPRPQPGDNPPG